MEVLISLLVLCLILGLVWWAISIIPLPPPAKIVAQVVLAIIAIIALLELVPVHWRAL